MSEATGKAVPPSGASGSRRPPIITIDGPVGAGKSSVARRLAAVLGFRYLETGAMYRAVALLALEAGVRLDDTARLVQLAESLALRFVPEGAQTRIWLGERELTEILRTREVARAAAEVAALAEVRRALVAQQRRLAAAGGIVVEGRDAGTVICPEAELKIFLTASAQVRAARRRHDLAAQGERLSEAAALEDVQQRDRRDATRAASPLLPAPDAVIVDTTALELEEVVRLLAWLVREQAAG